MVRNYVRKRTQQRLWGADRMKSALKAVVLEGSSAKRAGLKFEVPYRKLARIVHQYRLNPELGFDSLVAPKENFAHHTVFNKEQEQTLNRYVITLQNNLNAVTGTDIRCLAYNMAEHYNVPHKFKKDLQMAGEDWLHGFLKRHPHIKLKRNVASQKKKPDHSKDVDRFFNLYKTIISKHRLKSENVFVVDEIIITCLSESSNYSNLCGAENVQSLAPNKICTATVCFSASGAYTPLLLIFPVEAENEQLLNEAPLGSWAAFEPTGRMNLEIFIKWFKTFITLSKVTKKNPVLLIVDNYQQYFKNFSVMKLADDNGVIILSLPPNCANELHPLKHSFTQTLSSAYMQEVWTSYNCSKIAPMEMVYKLFGKAFVDTATHYPPVSSFETSGIWPPKIDEIHFIEVEEENNASRSSHDDEHETNDTSYSGNQSLSSTVENEKSSPNSSAAARGSLRFTRRCKSEKFIPEVLPVEAELHDNEEQRNDSDIEPSIHIPHEAELTEVSTFKQLHELMINQHKLYFYVSPHKLKTS